MYKKQQLPLLLIIFWFVTFQACNHEPHFITDANERAKVKTQFEKQVELASARHDTLFGVFNQDLTTEEQEALQFLYAYMPMSDLADYNGSFFLKNVQTSFAARDTFSWGAQIPEQIFRHFVMPVRINNENLDSSRWVIFEELKDRIKGMTMEEAALEVNHWCHEKVTYKGTDIRTSSPLATIKTAYGRCGEESTLTTAAMRAVGIPARQCYTPRWAHGDDNHAWVEVWIDSTWRYLGACEPEPVLDMAWFTAPAKRAMMVATNVFGDYEGPEEVLLQDDHYTRINVLSNYTETKTLIAKVVNIQQQPVSHAAVEFQLYNYAEFYPLLQTSTDENGLASIHTGYGDLLVWASNNNRFGFAKADVRRMDTILVVLELTDTSTGAIDLDFIPPVAVDITEEVGDSLKAVNKRRFAVEDEIRKAYENTFVDSVKSIRLAKLMNVSPDLLWPVLKSSRGNWRTLVEFISDTPDSLKHWVFPLLDAISKKDLRDVNLNVLQDAIKAHPVKLEDVSGIQNQGDDAAIPESMQVTDVEELVVPYIMNPRIDNELLKPFHGYLRSQIDPELAINARKDPTQLATWVDQWVNVQKQQRFGRPPITPVGVYALKQADPHSRDLFFVAACRSIGIPARLDPATKVPQYVANNRWNDYYFEDPPEHQEKDAMMVLYQDPRNPVKPQYYIHYTVEQEDDGFFRSLDYESSDVVAEFPATLDLVPGSYMIVMGNRVADGTVLSRLVLLNLGSGKTIKMPLTMRQDFRPLPVFGSFNPKQLQADLGNMHIRTELTHGLVMAWVDPDTEPSRHFLADLHNKAKSFQAWDGNVILFFPNQAMLDRFKEHEGSMMPDNVRYALHEDYSFDPLNQVVGMTLKGELPVVLGVNPSGGVNYYVQGYRIGIGNELLRIFPRWK